MKITSPEIKQLILIAKTGCSCTPCNSCVIYSLKLPYCSNSLSKQIAISTLNKLSENILFDGLL